MLLMALGYACRFFRCLILHHEFLRECIGHVEKKKIIYFRLPIVLYTKITAHTRFHKFIDVNYILITQQRRKKYARPLTQTCHQV